MNNTTYDQSNTRKLAKKESASNTLTLKANSTKAKKQCVKLNAKQEKKTEIQYKKKPKILAKSTEDNVITSPRHLVAVDLGSNSFHLIIAREQDGCLQILQQDKQSIGLAAGLDKHNVLQQNVIDKAINCLRDFNLSIVDLPYSAIRIVATQTLRAATNIEDFKKQAHQVFPYPIEVISGKLEAELIYKGVAHTQPLRGATFIIDIGGGSTELVIGHNFATSITDSLAMGCISVQQKFFLDGSITPTAMRNAQDFAHKQLAGIADRYRAIKSKTILGTSGSIKVISQAMLELYGDNKITAKRLNRLVQQLIRWQHCNNIPLRSLEDARRPIFASAVAVLSSCFNQLGIEQMKFSLGGLREGVLYGLSQSRTDIDTRERTIHNLIKLYHVDQAFNQGVLQQITLIKQQLKKTNAQLSHAEFSLLCWAAQLHEIGIAINSSKHQKHGAYIIEHSDMPGFSESEKEIITLLVRNHRGKINLDSIKVYNLKLAHKLENEFANEMNNAIEDELDHEFEFQPSNSSARITPNQNNMIISEQRIGLLIQLLRLAIIFTQGRVQTLTTSVIVDHDEDELFISHVGESELQKKLLKEIEKQAKAGLALRITA
ncbi:Ppx/GppA phosphatase family protein [Colwellia echini]|uniref:Ppx/GppA family phosphatase n=1 Tax=Colwellia echini TaxID=1982103 RepID=A0ABY3MUB9_9GAMM|nr:Ppx/GppA phosphatase family protein [Colwellia echini]TYK64805.1 Ppx/GppA family phosphatase [Colwellia echini]